MTGIGGGGTKPPIGSPSSKGPSIGGLFGGVTSPIVKQVSGGDVEPATLPPCCPCRVQNCEGHPPQRNRSSMLRSAYPPPGGPPRFPYTPTPPRGDPLDFPIPPQGACDGIGHLCCARPTPPGGSVITERNGWRCTQRLVNATEMRSAASTGSRSIGS